MSLPKVFKLPQAVWELWPIFGIRGDVYNRKSQNNKFAYDMPTGPDLSLYQILSKYFKLHTEEFGLEIHLREVTRNQLKQRLSFLHATRLLVLIYASKNIIKIFQTIKSLNAQDLGLDIYSLECTRKRSKQELSFLHVTLLPNLIYVQTYCQVILKIIRVIACTTFQLQGR